MLYRETDIFVRIISKACIKLRFLNVEAGGVEVTAKHQKTEYLILFSEKQSQTGQHSIFCHLCVLVPQILYFCDPSFLTSNIPFPTNRRVLYSTLQNVCVHSLSPSHRIFIQLTSLRQTVYILTKIHVRNNTAK